MTNELPPEKTSVCEIEMKEMRVLIHVWELCSDERAFIQIPVIEEIFIIPLGFNSNSVFEV